MKYKFTVHYTTTNGRHYSCNLNGLTFDTLNPCVSGVTDVETFCGTVYDTILRAQYVSVDTARGKAALVTKHILMIEIVPEEINE